MPLAAAQGHEEAPSLMARRIFPAWPMADDDAMNTFSLRNTRFRDHATELRMPSQCSIAGRLLATTRLVMPFRGRPAHGLPGPR